MSRAGPFTFYEFFAGGGMARTGLGAAWTCLFANDFDPGKAAVYRANFGDADFREADVWSLSPRDLPGRADLAWASSPCQDLSLAGGRRGLSGQRSSAFWGFWGLIEALDEEGRAPRVLGVENVTGLLTSHDGQDFETLCRALADRGYAFGAMEIDAAQFLPQSRPRLFILACRGPVAEGLTGGPSPAHGAGVLKAHERLAAELRDRWLWWRLPAPPRRNTELGDLLEPDHLVGWFDPARTEKVLALMSDVHRARIALAQAAGERRVGAVFRRMRVEAGRKVQRAEVRFDGLAGCLRTPAGGSSRQVLVVVDGPSVRMRLLTAREAARLMGLGDDYRLPKSANAGLRVAGDGVAAPVVRHLAAHILEPLLSPPAAVAA